MSSLNEVDLVSEDAIADPYRATAPLREEGSGVHFNEPYGGWVITRYDDVQAALLDWERLSSDRISAYYAPRVAGPKRALYEPTYDVLKRWMVFIDPPDHKRLRTLVEHAFKPRTLEARESAVAALIDDLLEPLGGRFDWVSSFAYLLPVLVISEFLGVPASDRELIKGWSDDIMNLIFGAYEVSNRHERARDAFSDFGQYLRDHVRHRTRSPGDDLVTELIAARDADERLSEDEIVATCVLLLFGGHETTTNLLANGLRALLMNPSAARQLRDPSSALGKWPIEELLRFDGPSKAAPRIARIDHERGGQRIRAGDKVLILQCAANRDPRQFTDPDRLELARKPNLHLTFGYGIHYCIGAPLARLEGRLALPRVLHRFPELSLPLDAPQPWVPTILSRALRSLTVDAGPT